jgi:hypothetical protein
MDKIALTEGYLDLLDLVAALDERQRGQRASAHIAARTGLSRPLLALAIRRYTGDRSSPVHLISRPRQQLGLPITDGSATALLCLRGSGSRLQMAGDGVRAHAS